MIFFILTAIIVSIFTLSSTVKGEENYYLKNDYICLQDSNVLPFLDKNNVQKLGSVEDNKELTITIGLKIRNKNTLKKIIQNAHNEKKYNKVISSEDLKNNYLPAKDSQDELINFLQSNGLIISKTYSSFLSIQAKGTAKEIESAFKVSLNYYSKNRQVFFANSNQPQLPIDIVGLVENIDGLNNFKLQNSMSDFTTIKSKVIGQVYPPSQIQKAYNMTTAYSNNINGSGVKLAIASYYSFNQNDINFFMNRFNINPINAIKIVPIDGTPQYDINGSAETTMDIECALSSAPGAQLLVYDGANPDSVTQTDMFTQIVDDGQANVVSYSWGIDETYYSQAEINEMDNIFMTGAAKGITFVIASGDNGSSEVDYPASDPYVTAIGGTSLNTNSTTGAITSETGWSLDINGNGSGGGESSFFF